MSDEKGGDVKKKEEEEDPKKPEDTDFRQQRLRAWQPLLTPKWVIITFFIVGFVFLPIGAYILYSSGAYSNCVILTRTMIYHYFLHFLHFRCFP